MSGCGNAVVVAGGAFSLHTFKTTILSPVGGEALVFDKLMLRAPYLALVLVAGTVATGVLLRRRMP